MTPVRPLCIVRTVLNLTAALTWPDLARSDDPFAPGCTLPFASIAKTEPLDSSCPVEGQGSAISQLSNLTTNNSGATGTPVTLPYQNFESLQTAVKHDGTTPFGCPTSLPTDGSKLTNIFTLSRAPGSARPTPDVRSLNAWNRPD